MNESNARHSLQRMLVVAGMTALTACAGPAPVSNVPSYTQQAGYPAPSGISSVPPAETSGQVVAYAPRYASTQGMVTAIEPMREPRSAVSPGGAILGAVVGGLIGSQVGAGSGKTVATVAGVAGGALAGNAIGNRVDAPSGAAVDHYRIAISYNGGGGQAIDVPTPGDLRVGDRVRVDDNRISRY